MAFAVTAVATAGTFAGAGLLTGIAGGIALDATLTAGAVSYMGSQQSAAAQRSAGAANLSLSNQQADAQRNVAKYQANLNYQSAVSQAHVEEQNATADHASARSIETEGLINETAQLQKGTLLNSALKAAYGATGVQSDVGTPLVVAGYNAAMQQTERMNTAYDASVGAMQADWKGALEEYQSKLSMETATQYQYASEMADWTASAQKAGALVAKYEVDTQATTTEINGISGVISSIGNASQNYALASYRYGNPNNTNTTLPDHVGIGVRNV